MLRHVSVSLFSAIHDNLPMVTYDKTAMMMPGVIASLLFGTVYMVALWRYSAVHYRTERERDRDFVRVAGRATIGMWAGILLAVGGCLLVFNPLIEHYALSAQGYTRCPNQMQLNFEWRLDVWVKHPRWCFDKGFHRSFSYESKITPLQYLQKLEDSGPHLAEVPQK